MSDRPRLTRRLCRKGHELTPETTVVVYTHGKPYNQCSECLRTKNADWYRRKRSRKEAAKLAEGLMRMQDRMFPPENPSERYMTKEDARPEVRSIGQAMREN